MCHWHTQTSGLQAGVYELVCDDGTVDKVKVLKAKHRYALMTKMQREWEVGRRISSLKSPEHAMPGYMSVGAAVCTENGNFKGKHKQKSICKPTCMWNTWHLLSIPVWLQRSDQVSYYIDDAFECRYDT